MNSRANHFWWPAQVCLAFVLIGLKRTVAYPIEIIGMFVSAATYAAIYLLVSTSDGNSLDAAVQYWLTAQIFYLSVRYPSTTLFSADQRLERLAILQTEPISHFCRLLWYQVGTRLTPVGIAIILYLVLCNWDKETVVRLTLTLPTVFVAGFALEVIIGVLFLHSTKTFGAGELKLKLMLLLSGILFEISRMPDLVRNLAYGTPFPWLVYEPSLYVSGKEASYPAGTLMWAATLTAIAILVSKRPTTESL